MVIEIEKSPSIKILSSYFTTEFQFSINLFVWSSREINGLLQILIMLVLLKHVSAIKNAVDFIIEYHLHTVLQ